MSNEQSATATATPVATPKAPAKPPKAKAKPKAKAPAKGKPTAKRGRPKGSRNKTAKGGRKPTARRGRTEATVEQLQRMLNRKQTRLERIKARQRESLVKQLAAVDAELAAVSEAQTGKRRKSAPTVNRRKRAGGHKNGTTLTDAIVKVLGRRSKGMSVKDVAVAVVKSGYQSSSKNLYPMVSQALRDKRFKKVARGVYAVK